MKAIDKVAFVDKHMPALVERVSDVMPIADRLRSRGMLHEESYSNMRALDSRHEKMRELYKALNSGGDKVKCAFYTALNQVQPHLVKDLNGNRKRARSHSSHRPGVKRQKLGSEQDVSNVTGLGTTKKSPKRSTPKQKNVTKKLSTTSDDQKESKARKAKTFCGYIHNVTEMKGSEGKNYFKALFQKTDGFIRLIGFKQDHQKELKELEKHKTPIKLQGVEIQQWQNRNQIKMNYNTKITKTRRLSFAFSDNLKQEKNGKSEKSEVCGYIHDVTEMREGRSGIKYFHAKLQGADGFMKIVGFEQHHQIRKRLLKAKKNRTPVKLQGVELKQSQWNANELEIKLKNSTVFSEESKLFFNFKDTMTQEEENTTSQYNQRFNGFNHDEADNRFITARTPQSQRTEPKKNMKTSQVREEDQKIHPVSSYGQEPAREEPRTQEEFYALTRRPCGLCLIINNYNFQSKGNREGTERDGEALTRVFTRMRFLVREKKDLSRSEILRVVEEFAEKDHSAYDVFVCCVLSHGKKGSILGTDGEEVQIRDLTQPFARCKSLKQKPKIFFIQACQGKKHQEGTPVQEDGYTDDDEIQEDALGSACRTIPREADFLIGMATVEDCVSFRERQKGSFYIQELCKQLETGCPRKEDILKILTRVNRNISHVCVLRGKKQMPEPRYTLTKTLVFPWE